MITNHPSHVLKALGIDTLDGDYHYDGTELHVEGHTEAELQAEHDKLDIPAIEKAERNEHVRQQRLSEYPDIGDQLDAIWKELNQLRLNGTNLVADADDVLGQILAVKKKHPKEK